MSHEEFNEASWDNARKVKASYLNWLKSNFGYDRRLYQDEPESTAIYRGTSTSSIPGGIMTPKKKIFDLELNAGQERYLRKLEQMVPAPLITDVPRNYRQVLSFHGLIEGVAYDGKVLTAITEKGYEYLEWIETRDEPAHVK